MKKKIILEKPDDILVKAGWQRDKKTGICELSLIVLVAIIKISNEQS